MIGMVHFGTINTDTPTEQQQIGIDFVKLDTWTTNGEGDVDVTRSFSNGTLTILKAGIYNIIFTCSFKGTNERDYDFALFQDGVFVPQVQTKRFQGPNLRTFDVYGGGVILVENVPSVLDIGVKCDVDDANVVIVEAATLSCFEIRVDISCKVTKSSNQSIPSSTDTILTWNQEQYDTDDMHDNSTNNSRITITKAGKYSITCQAAWGTSMTLFSRMFTLLKNGTDSIGAHTYSPINSGQQTMIWIEDLEVGDFLELLAFHDNPQNIDFKSEILTNEGPTYFSVIQIDS